MRLDSLIKLKKELSEITDFSSLKYETVFNSLFLELFGDKSEFYKASKKIKSGYHVEGSVDYAYGKISLNDYNRHKNKAYTDLLDEAITYVSEYETKEVEIESASSIKSKVFIVHGHDGELKYKMSDWLHRIGLEPIILHLAPNCGVVSIIDKIRQNDDVDCAIVLMTADDEGKAKEDECLNKRARQNVVFEAGYFIGKLGLDRVIMIYDEGIEAPGDLSGCVYILADPFDGWKEKVREEFRKMNINYSG